MRTAERSGAVVIKMAQWASSRPDMFGEAACTKLKHLMDRTPQHAWRHTEETLAAMFGPEWSERLRLERKPIGSGCIAQVYRGQVLVPRGRPLTSLAGGQAAAKLASAPGADPAKPPPPPPPLPPGWQEAVDKASGDVYYYNLDSGVAQLRRPADEEWTDVAVKVLHPGVRTTVMADMDLLRLVARLLTCLPGVTWLNPMGMVDDFGRMLTTQLDLRIEADNLRRFLSNFPPETDLTSMRGIAGSMGIGAAQPPLVLFPIPLDAYCTTDVIVETFIEGVPLTDWVRQQTDADAAAATAAAADGSSSGSGGSSSSSSGSGSGGGSAEIRHKLCNRGIDAFLQMVFHDNFVHGDLHPGNILVTPQGMLAFIDAGIALTYTEEEHQIMVDLIGQFLQYDGRKAAEVLLRSAPYAHDPEGFKAQIEQMVHTATTENNFFERVGDYYAQICSAACEHRVQLQAGFMSIAISVKAVEGAALAVYPKVNLGQRARGIILREHTRRKLRALISRSLDTVERVHDTVQQSMTKEGILALTADARATWEQSLSSEAWERVHNTAVPSVSDSSVEALSSDARAAWQLELSRAHKVYDFRQVVEREMAAARQRRGTLVTALQERHAQLTDAASETVAKTRERAAEKVAEVHAVAVDAAERMAEQHEEDRVHGPRTPASLWTWDVAEISSDLDLIRADMSSLANRSAAAGESIRNRWVASLASWREYAAGTPRPQQDDEQQPASSRPQPSSSTSSTGGSTALV